MATTKEIILDIEVNNKAAIENIVRLNKQLDELKVAQLTAKAAFEQGIKTQEEYDREMAAIAASMRDVKTQMRETNKEIDANIQKQEAQEGSLKQMRAQFKGLIKEYDEMSAAVRNSDVGQSKQKEIADLQKELKLLEGETGRFQRNVGDYRNAIQEALNGTLPLKTVFKDLKNEIQTMNLQWRMMGSEIDSQNAKLKELANTVGTDSQEYKEQEQVLNDLQKKYNETGDAINNMQIAAGNISDTIADTNASIANFGKDNANMKAIAEGMGVMANSYQVAQAGMAALGIQSEAMLEVWAKMQVIQQGVNALNQIFNALEKESVLRQQLHIVVNKLLGKTIQQTAAAKTEDAAASAAAAAGDTALAAGEVAATTAAGGLVTALKAVGAAIKSIPIIGWIAGVVAILGTLTALLVKHNKAEKENNQTLQQRKVLMREINEIEKDALESVQKNVVAMETNVRRLKEAKQGTQEWSNLVKQVAGDLGVTEEWLQKNVDKVDALKDAWVNMQIAMAKGEAYAKKIADNEIKIATAEAEIARIMSDTKYKDRAEAISKELGVSIKAAKALVEADHKLKKNDTSANFVAYANAKNAIIEEIRNQNKVLMDGLDEAYNQQVEASEELAEIAGDGIKDTTDKAKNATTEVTEDAAKKFKKLSEQLEDLMVEGMADGLEKQVKQIRLAADRWIQSMKEAREKDLDNKELYDKLIEEKERQTQKSIKDIRDKGYRQIAQQIKAINDAYNDVISDSKQNPLSEFLNRIKQSADDTQKKIDDLKKEVNDTVAASKSAVKDLQNDLVRLVGLIDEDLIADRFKKLGFTDEDAQKMASEVKKKLEIAFMLDQPEIKLSGKKANGEVETFTTSIKDLFKFISKSLDNLEGVDFFFKTKDILDDIESKEKDIEKVKQKNVDTNVQTLITARKINQEYTKTAKLVQEQLLAQAESGTLGVIPDTFEVYVDFKIEDLETKLAEAKDKLNKVMTDEDYEKAEKEVENITKELEKQYNILQNIKNANKFAEVELKIETGEGLDFFDSTEIMAQQLLIDKLQAQIDALNESKRQGMEIEQQVAEKEAEYNKMLEEYNLNKMMHDKDENERSEEELERRKNEIEQLKTEMAALGYTGSDEMDKLIAALMAKMNKASKDMKNIWAQNATTVLQSFQKVTSAFQELISSVGEDNAELTNFLEAIGYVNIMLNMAVGISEAVAAGAGQPFPYNLAAIAAGVAAVVSGIASAISLYKQNHKNVSSPKFAEGGVIGGRTARTKSEGRRDDVPIWASKGEYIINAEAVKKYGIDFFDEINFGKKLKKLNLTGRYADGGVVTQTVVQQANNQTMDYSGLVDALQQMPNPIVAVSEINKVQRRVKIKEDIARNK